MNRFAHFDTILPNYLGFNSFFDAIDRLLNEQQTSTPTGFPPLNVYRADNGNYLVELAVAGFKKSDIKIEHDEKNSILMIKGAKASSGENAESSGRALSTTVKNGIAQRAFVKSFTVANDLYVSDAKLEDGLLQITLCKREPAPDQKPLQIELH
jgi:molecular chaperone IbpA